VTRRAAAAAIAALLLGLPTTIAPAAATTGGGPILGQAAMHDVSPPLRDIAPIPPTADGHGPPRERLENRPTHPGRPTTAVTDPVVQSTAGTTTAPSAINNFEGVSNLDGVYPPDTNGDVGPNDYVQWVNLHFQIFSKSGVSRYGPAAGNTLWSGFGGPCATQNAGDPIALYDPLADRWVMAQFTSSSPYGECVAVSTTSDPTGSYYRYFFQFSTSTFYDYPHLGVWSDGYYLSANRFGGLFGTFQGASAIVLDRTHMLLGQPAAFQQFNTSTSYGTLLPADLDGTAPPTNSPEVFGEIGSTTLHLWKFHVDWATPASSTFSAPTSLGVAAYNRLCPTTRSCIPQPGTSVGLDGLGDRLMYRLAYRNFGDHESLVVNHAVNAASTGIHAGVRWYEVRYTGGIAAGSASLYQQGTYAPDTDNRWLGGVAMDGSGNMALGYSVASSSTYAGIRYTGRLVGDPLGQMTQSEATIVAGAGSQTGSGSRWGDYAMMAVDPIDNCTFWFTTEYMPSTGPAPWQTRIASFKFPSCGGSISQAPTITSANATTFTSGTLGSFTVTTTGSPPMSISEAGTLPTGVTFVDNHDGTATLSGTPTGATGTYPLTIKASNGALPDASQSFTLTVNASSPALAVRTTSLPSGRQGGAYSTKLLAENGTTPYSWAVVSGSGALPTGLGLSPDGTISGTPTKVGNFTFTVRVTDQSSPVQTANATLSIKISQH
jgi:Putative Ig domain.